ncbi:MAG: Uma2 family endonuclease [Bryobacteraceae bacterium]
MAVKTLLSLEEFSQLPDDGMQHELDEGELITMPPPKFGHGVTQARLTRILSEFVERFSLGVVVTESGYLLSSDPATVRAPDVSFVRQERLELLNRRDWPASAPDLAVEIVSPSDTAGALERKVRQYLKAGARTVWVVYPGERTLHVYEASGAARILDANQTLTADHILPGFSVPVSKLFD